MPLSCVVQTAPSLTRTNALGCTHDHGIPPPRLPQDIVNIRLYWSSEHYLQRPMRVSVKAYLQCRGGNSLDTVDSEATIKTSDALLLVYSLGNGQHVHARFAKLRSPLNL